MLYTTTIEWLIYSNSTVSTLGGLAVHEVLYGGKFGGGKVWRIDSFRAFGKRKFGKLTDQPIDY